MSNAVFLMNDARDLARYIIQYANERQARITQLKLQKILYYVQGNIAGQFNRRFFADEIEAWQYGPVVRSVYTQYSLYGALPIICKPIDLSDKLLYDAEEKELIDDVINRKLCMSEIALVNATHAETPWKEQRYRISEKPIIPFERIMHFFSESVL